MGNLITTDNKYCAIIQNEKPMPALSQHDALAKYEDPSILRTIIDPSEEEKMLLEYVDLHKSTKESIINSLKDFQEIRISIQDKEDFRIMIETLFLTPTNLLNHYLEASLSNSNPLLHTSRLYSLWNNWTESEVYDHTVLFYDEWTDEASDLLIQMDREFMTLLDRLPVDKLQIPSILTYYGSTDICSLTQKIRSINAFKSIEAPMIQVESGWIPDFNSRYFTEDFPFGLRFIKEEAENYNIQTPMKNLIS